MAEEKALNWQDEQPALGSTDSDATPLCMNCLNPVDPRTYYCPNCESDDGVNPLATYLPFESLRFTYGGFARLWGWLMPPGAPTWVKIVLTACLLVPFTWPLLLVVALAFWVVEPRRVRWYTLLVLLALTATFAIGYAIIQLH